jgi:hypothetical protein
MIPDAQYQNAYQYEIFRGDTEHYLAVVSDTPDVSGNRLRVFDLNSGLPCYVKFTSDQSYLLSAAAPKDAFTATTLEDITFIGNREVNMVMDPNTLSPPVANDCILYWRAGGYSVTFKVNIHLSLSATFSPTISIASPAVFTKAAHGLVIGQAFTLSTTGALPTGLVAGTTYYALAAGFTANTFQAALAPGGTAIITSGTQSGVHTLVATGVTYTYSYLTPDNSISTNAAYIATNQLAAIFYKGFTGANPPTLGGTGGVQAAATPLASSTSASGDLLTSVGFSVFINGSCLKLSRSDNQPYTVDCTDGVGDTYLKAIKDTAKAFSDLPSGCFVGFTTRVIGTNKATSDDYYVTFSGADGVSGAWKECVAPATKISPLASTMPHALINTGEGAFEWKELTWGKRLSGDGINSTLDPSFIGKQIQDLFYDNARLGILTEGSAVWSHTRNPYVFFPDSAQTTLATDPVDATIGGGKRIAILRRVIQINEATYLWAQKLQFRVSSGVNPFKADTIESKLSTAYEFSPVPVPCSVGESLYFASEPGPYATIRDLTVDVNGRSQGAVDVTAHVKKFIPSGVRYVTASDTLGTIVVASDRDPKSLYVYNYLLTTTDRIQSAWNKWRLPANCTVLWASLSRNYLYLLVQRDDGAAILKIDLSVDLTDTEEGATYLTRLDFRTTEYDCGIAYNPGPGTTTIKLPYACTDVSGWTDPFGLLLDSCPLFVAQRVTTENAFRGKAWWIKSIVGDTITVSGDASGEGFYVGYRISAEREQNTFYLKDQFGPVAAHRLTVKDFEVAYSGTGYFKAIVDYTNKPSQVVPMSGRLFGSPDNHLGMFPLGEGFFNVPINSESFGYTLRLINDSFLPSKWTSAKYNYLASFLAKPTPGQGRAGNS